MMRNQRFLNRIRKLNKAVTNKVLIRISGKRFGHFAILGHRGRKTGALYRIPIIAEPFQDGFVIALTYGKKVDWYANVIAHDGCTLLWKEKEYHLASPTLICRETGVAAFPSPFKQILHKVGIEDFLYLAIASNEDHRENDL